MHMESVVGFVAAVLSVILFTIAHIAVATMANVLHNERN